MAANRPGGLTALAVLNFVFGGLGLIGLLIIFAAIGVVDKGTGGAVSSSPEAGMVYGRLALGLVAVGILIAAGVGYLGQKKSGRTMGTMYGVLGLAATAFDLAVIKSGFGIFTIIGLVYPVLTLILVNSTFKDDLVN